MILVWDSRATTGSAYVSGCHCLQDKEDGGGVGGLLGIGAGGEYMLVWIRRGAGCSLP